jgi:hypothetical protein
MLGEFMQCAIKLALAVMRAEIPMFDKKTKILLIEIIEETKR